MSCITKLFFLTSLLFFLTNSAMASGFNTLSNELSQCGFAAEKSAEGEEKKKDDEEEEPDCE